MAHVTMSPGAKGALTRQSIRATLTRASLMKEAETMEPPQQKRKRQFDFMTSDILRSKQMHLLADQYFSSLGNTVFVVSALITLVQAALATVAQAKNVSEDAQSKFNITIALLSAFSVFWQSFAKHWDFSGRAGLHKSASSALTKLHTVALLRAREEQAKDSCATADCDDDSNGNNAVPLLSKKDLAGLGVVEEGVEGINTDLIPTDLVGVGIDEDGEDDTLDDLQDLHKKSSNILATLTKQFEQATEGCTSSVPVKITAAFETLDTRIGVCKKEIGSTGLKNDPRRVKWEKVYPSLYSILTTTIISQPGWPFLLPNPDKIVDKAMEKFSKLNTNLLESLLHRNRKIDNLYDGVSESTPLIEVA